MVQLQPTFVLHTRPYRDTSLLVEALTRDYGRLALVARGQRQSRQKARRPVQAFTPLLFSWQGKTELKTLTGAETSAVPAFLSGAYLYSGLYANELLMRLVPQGDAHEEIFTAYKNLLASLVSGQHLQSVLRQFEFRLLQELGYGLDLNADANTGAAIIPEQVYHYLSDLGFLRVGNTSPQAASGFLGKDLLAIANGDYSLHETQRAAKRLARLALAPHLGNKPLKSRELFRKQSPVASLQSPEKEKEKDKKR